MKPAKEPIPIVAKAIVKRSWQYIQMGKGVFGINTMQYCCQVSRSGGKCGF